MVAVKHSKKIYALKNKYQKGICESDILPEKKSLTQLLVLGFVGGWISGALGIGGGTIFNPVFISMNMTPQVATSTGQYLILFSTVASCSIYLVYGTLNWQYGLWVAAWCAIAA